MIINERSSFSPSFEVIVYKIILHFVLKSFYFYLCIFIKFSFLFLFVVSANKNEIWLLDKD